jgi:hypothetical protein
MAGRFWKPNIGQAVGCELDLKVEGKSRLRNGKYSVYSSTAHTLITYEMRSVVFYFLSLRTNEIVVPWLFD